MFMLGMLLAASLNAQTVVTIGQSSMTANYPFYAPLENGRTQLLYTAAEIGMAGDIEGLAFNFANTADFAFENLTIRMAQTTASTLNTTYSGAMQTVYSHTFQATATGWQTLLFDQTFSYDGISNLLIDICYSNSAPSSYTGGVSVMASGVASKTLFSVATNEAGCTLTDLTSSYFRPNIQLSIIGPDDCGPCRPYLVQTLGTSAHIAWKQSGSAQRWKVAYSTTPLTAPDSATHIVTATQPECTLQGLNTMTHYYIYIRTYCSNGDSSSWAKLEFTTPNIIATLPFVCDFESAAQNQGWQFYHNNGSTNNWHIGTAAQAGGQKSLYISDADGLTNHYTPSASQTAACYDLLFNESGKYRLTFDWRGNGTLGSDEFSLWLCSTDDNPLSPSANALKLTGQPGTSSDWTRYSGTFNASPLANTTQRLVILWNNGDGNVVQPPAALDNLRLEKDTSPDTTIVDLCTPVALPWKEDFEQNFEWQCWQHSDGNGDGKTFVLGTQNGGRVLAYESGDTTTDEWLRLPYLALNNDSAALHLDCRSTFADTLLMAVYAQLYDAANPALLRTFSITTGYQRITIPLADFRNLKVRIALRLTHSRKSHGLVTLDNFEARAISACDAGSCAYTVITQNQGSNAWTSGDAYLSVRADGFEIKRIIPRTACDTFAINICSNAVADFFWYGNGTVLSASGFVITDPAGNELCRYTSLPAADGLIVSQQNHCNCCPLPTELAARATHNSAMLSWQKHSASRWEVLCFPSHLTPADATAITVTQVPYTVENLQPQGTYRFFVRTVCDTLHSAWQEGPLFTTTATPAMVPYNNGFENDGENALWVTINNDNGYSNEWCIGNAVNHGGNQALYITNDLNTKPNQANLTASSVTWAYRDITFTPQEAYVLRFDWKGKGLTNKSFLNVYLGDLKNVSASQDSLFAPLAHGLTPIATNLCGQENWTTHTITLDGNDYSGQTKRLYFMWCNTAGAGEQPPVAIDNITIGSCIAPNKLTVSNITGTAATLHWTGISSQYQIEVVRISDDFSQTLTANDTSLVLTGLTLYADYKCRVRSQCGTHYSDYTDYVTFSMCPSFDNNERVWYVSQQVGSPNNLGYLSTEPASDLATVLASPCLQEGDIIKVAAGDYKPATMLTAGSERTKTFLISKNINIVGGWSNDFSTQNADQNLTILNGDIGTANVNTDNAQHVVYFQPAASKASIEGFTIMNGHADGSEANAKNGGGIYGGTAINCHIKNNYSAGFGGGVYTTSLTNCIVENNSAMSNGAGTYQSTVHQSVIRNNNTNGFGGGLYQGAAYQSIIDSNKAYFGAGCYNTTLYNCLVKYNTAAGNGGGKYGGNSYNCTYVYNTANTGGGIYNGAAYNSVFWKNSSQTANVSLNYCAVQGQTFTAGSPNITLAADNDGNVEGTNYVRFIDPTAGNFQLQYESACVNAGNNSYMTVSETDLAGNPRLCEQTIDIGAYEFAFDTNCLPVANPAVVLIDRDRTTVSWQSDSGYLKFKLRIKEQGSNSYLLMAETTETSYTFTGLELYKTYEWQIMKCCSASDSSIYLSGPSFKTCPAFDDADHRIWYVSQEAGSTDNMGSRRTQPARHLSQVLDCDCLQDGDTILMAKGNYQPTQTIMADQSKRHKTFFINKNITIIGGYDQTFTQCDTALNPTVLDGRLGTGDTDRVYHVVICEKTLASHALLKNLTIRGGNATNPMGMTYNSTIYDGLSGGGIMYGNIERCVVEDNRASLYGGGTYGTDISFSLIRNNRSAMHAAGIYQGNVEHSIVANNCGENAEYAQGGGMWGGTAINTYFSDNANYYGGATYGTTLHNCLVINNKSVNGGVCQTGALYNCTVVDNHSLNGYSGSSEAQAYNSIFWHNDADHNGQAFNGSFQYCAIENYNSQGDGNIMIASDNQGSRADVKYVRFEDPAAGIYRLQYGSDCINAGNNSFATQSMDLAGYNRIIDSIVDMGAYEFVNDFDCQPVANLRIVKTDTSSATVAWDADSSYASFHIRLRKAGETAYHFTDSTTSNQFTFNNLEKFAEYEWGVLSHCRNGEASVYISGPNFRACPNFDDPNRRIWYVSATNGQDNAFGTRKEMPAKNIADVISCNCFEEGDSILVAMGTYYPTQSVTFENKTFNTFYIDKAITLVGGYDETFTTYQPQQYPTILDGNVGNPDAETDNSLHIVTVKPSAHVLIKGFTIQNGYNADGYGAGVYNGQVEDCIIQNNSALYGGGIAYGTAINTIIRHNSASQLGGGSYLSQLYNCQLTDNTAASGGGSAYTTDYNCTYAFNHAQFGGGAVTNGTSYNTIIWHNGTDNHQNSQLGAEQKLYYCAIEEYEQNDNHNIALSAENYGQDTSVNYVRFENPESRHFELQYGSSCINKGDNNSVHSNFDIAGNQRISEKTVDLGAFESNYSALLCPPATRLEVQNITLTTADLSWQGSTPFYKVKYKTAAQREYQTIVTDKKQITLKELEPASQYEWRLLALCNLEGDSSVYVSGASFRTCLQNAQRTWYANAESGNDDNYGASPEEAVQSLDRMLTCGCLQEGDTILLSAGTYVPTLRTDSNEARSATFTLDKDLVIRGGFSPDFQIHNTNLYPTVLSGDLGIKDDISDNTFHVVSCSPYAQVKLEYVTITNGNSSGSQNKGSAIISGQLYLCVVTQNHGTAAYNTQAEHTTFSHNSGAGYALYADAGQTINHCTFEDNQCSGAAAHGNTTITHSIFRNNHGGVSLDHATLSNCLIYNNICDLSQKGAGIYLNNDNILINNTIVNNIGEGGIYDAQGNSTIENCIVWGNRLGSAISNIAGSGSTYQYCAIEGTMPAGNHNLMLASDNDGRDTNYHYVRFINPDHGDFRLHISSDCIDKGNPKTDTMGTDLEGNRRVLNHRADVGCYESTETSACEAPVNLMVTQVTAKTAILNWSKRGNANSWRVDYYLDGDEGHSRSVETNDTTITLTGLTGYKNYVATVSALCSTEEASPASLPTYFQTLCDSASIIWVGNFNTFAPMDREIVYDNIIPIAWNAIPKIEYYDVYIWKEGEPKPLEPTFGQLHASYCIYGENGELINGQTYNWQVVAIQQCQSLISDTIHFKMYDLPDLHITSIEHTAAQAGKAMTVTWTVRNDGLGNCPQTAAWTESVWLTPDCRADNTQSEDMCLTVVNSTKPLNAGESYSRSAEVVIPATCVGDYHLFVMTNISDAYDIVIPDTISVYPYTPNISGTPYPYLTASAHLLGDLQEQNPYDNFFFQMVNILPPPSPDLIPVNITAPATAVANSHITLSWDIVNQGAEVSSSSWHDAVYICADTEFNLDNALYLGHLKTDKLMSLNDTAHCQMDITLPAEASGNYYVYVMTDIENAIYEGLGESNNTVRAAGTLNIQPIPTADLQVTQVTIPSTISLGSSYPISYTVINDGDTTTNAAEWQDYLYLSQDSIFDIANAYPIGTVAITTPLARNTLYTIMPTITIPSQLAAGNWYLYVMADGSQQVLEGAHEDNNLDRSTMAATLALPDLTVRHVTYTEAPNQQSITINWELANMGEGTLSQQAIVEHITINNEEVAQVESSLSLQAGESQHHSYQIPFRCAEQLQVNIHARADVDADTTNNRSSATIDIHTPDLMPTAITTDRDTLTAGTSVALQWRIANKGETEVVDFELTDDIYLSTTTTFDQSQSVKVGTITRVANISPESTIATEMKLDIPEGLAGTYYLHIMTNADQRLCEGKNTFGNHLASAPIQVLATSYPDLAVTRCQVADTLTIGQSFSVNYAVSNSQQAQVVVNQRNWTDKIYLSTNFIFDEAQASLLYEAEQSRSLAIGESYEQTVSFSLPTNLVQGDYYLFTIANADGDLYETSTDNNIKRSQRIFIKNYPIDLAVRGIEGKDTLTQGEETSFKVTIKNSSAVATQLSEWTDALYLSADMTLDDGDIRLATNQHRSTLPSNGEYEVLFDVTMPYEMGNSAYLIAVADLYNSQGDIRYANNTFAKPIFLTATAAPDLAISQLRLLTDAVAGQPAQLSYVITNKGDKDISKEEWNDKLFLMGENNLLLTNALRTGKTVAKGTSYTDTITFTIPTSVIGKTSLYVNANANQRIHEALWTNNIDTIEVLVCQPAQGDLAIAHIQAQSTVTSGQRITIGWTLQNKGDYALRGSNLKELVYLSEDKQYDIGDQLIGTTTNDIFLPLNATAQHTISAKIHGVKEGYYYLIVKTDADNTFAELNEENNTAVTTEPIRILLQRLPFNTAVTDTLEDGYANDYLLVVGNNTNETVRICIKSGDSLTGAINRIYVQHNEVGGPLQYTFSSDASIHPEVYIPSTESDYYGIHIEGLAADGSQQPIVIRADILPFELTSVSPAFGGNTGKVTLELEGARFSDSTQVTLVSATETIIAESIVCVDAHKLYAQFDLTGKNTGLYTITAQDRAQTSSLPQAFEIRAGEPTTLFTNLLFPANAKPNQVVRMTLEFGNDGNVDIEAPTITLVSHGGAHIALTQEGLADQKESLEIPLRADDNPTAILRPGIRGTITVYAYTAGNLVFTIQQ